MSRVYACIDGFNLYNGAIRGTNDKWLDLARMCDLLVPHADVARVKYFTARVSPRPNDPGQLARQLTYWRALKTVLRIEIIEGHFLAKECSLPTAASVRAIKEASRKGVDTTHMLPQFERVWRAEEKGTDVNLAVHLVHDAHLGRFDQALVVSNDSDLCEAIRIVNAEVGKPVWVYTPHRRTPSTKLAKTATHFRILRQGVVAASQFRSTLTDSEGSFNKPTGW